MKTKDRFTDVIITLIMILFSLLNRDFFRLRHDYRFVSDVIDFRQDNGCIAGPSSMMQFLVVYMIIFLLILNYYNDQKDYVWIRLLKRQKVVTLRVKCIFKTVTLVFIPHFTIQFIYNVYYYPSFLHRFQYFRAEVIYGLMILLFFTVIGSLYMMLCDFRSKKIIVSVIYVSDLLFYFLNRFYFNGRFSYFFMYREAIMDDRLSFLEIAVWIVIFALLFIFNTMTMKDKIARLDIL